MRIMPQFGKALRSMPFYDRKLKAQIVPWSDKWHTLVGLMYVFDDPNVSDFLVYMAPQEGAMVVLVHKTKVAEVDTGNGVRFIPESQPDPECDEQVSADRTGQLVIGPSSPTTD